MPFLTQNINHDPMQNGPGIVYRDERALFSRIYISPRIMRFNSWIVSHLKPCHVYMHVYCHVFVWLYIG